ncbi:helix-turn-helix transcriptional regulator [Lentzea sp. BCCO 10_0798]|uniref:Helix-turn-helix transcriptional regulator n=1 Tax=Lentzea kristufekii TaxID=3095430 RepID=A0ABU4THV4_9PSEU|nr:helix-turn-helix transcriptional regulator [Lentzea sp. BCCO 10_0798]MDX8047839.1 helix-turn-helix transcriptional regulator [Lentzea sp. BCCO 10_0798]
MRLVNPAVNGVVVPDGPLPMLPPSTWESQAVRDAVAAESPGAVIAIARKAHGLRQDELGTLAGFSQSAISRLESGSNIAYDLRVLRTLQRLLGVPAHLLGLTDRTVPVRSGDLVVGMEGKALMTLCASAVFNADNDDDAVSQLLVLRRIVNDAHNWRATGALMPAVRSMYDVIDALRRNARGEVRRRLLGTGAMYAEFYGWLHEEVGDMRNATAWTSRALEQGQAADDRDVVAYCYVRLSQLAEADGDDDRVIGLARAAQRETGVSPVVRAMALRQEARGLARAGQDACLARFDLAQALVLEVRPPQSDEYSIGYCFTDLHVQLQRAASLVDLADHRRAIDVYTQLMPRWGSACQWEQGVHTATLAYAHAAGGDVERAVELGFVALDLARVTGSQLIVNELARLGPWAATPAIAELTAQLR